jgi:uncharacterized membrane protein YfcA
VLGKAGHAHRKRTLVPSTHGIRPPCHPFEVHVSFCLASTSGSCLFAGCVAYVVSLATSTAGVSGAFLLLPFQLSVLGLTSLAVTPTNHLFNVFATPSGIYRYLREGRMMWPLAAVIAVGTVPGVVVGGLARIYILPDVRTYKWFVGTVLLLLGVQLIVAIIGRSQDRPDGASASFRVRTLRFDGRLVAYEFQGIRYSVSIGKLALIAAGVGMVGGIYGVGGGAIMAPILVGVARLPIHTTAGATLFATFLTSLVGVGFFATAGHLLGLPHVSPDWWLGTSLGLGGLLGMYTGARLQRYLRARVIEVLLALTTTGLGLSYLIQYFL